MKPVRTAVTDLVYRGPTPEVGDLWTHRVEPGVVMSIWEPDEEEKRLIAEGGKVVIWIHSEPIPPVSLEVSNEEFTQPIGRHDFRVSKLDNGGPPVTTNKERT